MGKMVSILAFLAAAAVTAGTPGCIGGRFDPKDPTTDLDLPTRALIEGINAERAAKQLPAGSWIPELRPPALRGALAVARGDQSLKSAAHSAAQGGVTALGRHVWSFAAECADLRRFRPPAMATGQQMLLFSLATVAGSGGNSLVMLLIAEPGTSALRADQMGGGRGGTNPPLETYAHSNVASGPCGESWPAAQRTGW